MDAFDEGLSEQCEAGNWQSRYYFDPITKTCAEFWFDGCKTKSMNIFPSREACQCLCERILVVDSNSPEGPTYTSRTSKQPVIIAHRPLDVETHPVMNSKTERLMTSPANVNQTTTKQTQTATSTAYPDWAAPMFEKPELLFPGLKVIKKERVSRTTTTAQPVTSAFTSTSSEPDHQIEAKPYRILPNLEDKKRRTTESVLRRFDNYDNGTLSAVTDLDPEKLPELPLPERSELIRNREDTNEVYPVKYEVILSGNTQSVKIEKLQPPANQTSDLDSYDRPAGRDLIEKGTFALSNEHPSVDAAVDSVVVTDEACLEPFDERYLESCGEQTENETSWQPHYFYDATTRKCRMFWYDGCRGVSKNIFADLESCQWRCEGVHPEQEARSCLDTFDEHYKDDCREGNFEQRFYFEHASKQCLAFYYGGCARTSRNIFRTMQKCERLCQRPHRQLSRACNAPFHQGYTEACGNGGAFQQRFFYDSDLQQCRMFWFGNCKADNENIWKDLATCQWTCVRKQAQEPPRQCIDTFDKHYEDACRDGEWQERFYFDHRSGKCQPFWYDGCISQSQNMFIDKKSCEWLCQLPSPPYLPPAKDSTRCLDELAPGNCSLAYPAYYYDRQHGRCKPFYYTGCEGTRNRFLTLQQCDQTCSIFTKITGVHSDCLLTLDIGEGKYKPGCVRSAGYRYFYNHQYGQCGRFWFTGCGGNANKFSSMSECQIVCAKQPTVIVPQHAKNPAVCFQPKEPGKCSSEKDDRLFQIEARTRFYYSHQSKLCESFKYYGCDGNDNRFSDKTACENTCGGLIKPVNDRCKAWPDWGPCNQLRWMWHYNLTSGFCEQFLWGGCDGNGNRFPTFKKCQVACETPGVDVCGAPLDRGSWCEVMSFKFWFNFESGKCEGYHYTGCGKSKNRFDTLADCVSKCLSSEIDGEAAAGDDHGGGHRYRNYLLTARNRKTQRASGPEAKKKDEDEEVKEGSYKNKEPPHERQMTRHVTLSTAPSHMSVHGQNATRYLKSAQIWVDYTQCLGYRYNVSGPSTELRAYLCLMDQGVQGECVNEVIEPTEGEEMCRVVRPWMKGFHQYAWFFTIEKKRSYWQKSGKVNEPSFANVLLLGVNRCFDIC